MVIHPRAEREVLLYIKKAKYEEGLKVGYTSDIRDDDTMLL